MKLFLNISTLILFSLLFFACKSDDPLSSGFTTSDKYYEWSVINSPASNFNHMSEGNDHSLFISGFQSFRITDGTSQQINFNEPSFSPIYVDAYDKDYAVFLGYSYTPSDQKTAIKIYDNGAIRTYNFTPWTTELLRVYIDSRDKFYVYSISWDSLYLFNNGIVTTIKVPENNGYGNDAVFLMGKINSNLYFITSPTNGYISDKVVYKILPTEIVRVVSDSTYGSSYNYTGSNFIRRTESFPSPYYHYANFTETGWIEFLANDDYSILPTGTYPNNLVFFSNDTTNNYQAKVWNGTSLTTQSNFPQGITYNQSSPGSFLTEFKNGSFYFYGYSSGAKLVKGTLK
ncbi:MAG: hypothetical protein JST55_09495 [Bacteroidetes bacterium]|nr:hypothetical protein [Bacteroidota bacterium]